MNIKVPSKFCFTNKFCCLPAVDYRKVPDKNAILFNEVIIANKDNAIVEIPEVFRMFLYGFNDIPIDFGILDIIP